MTENSSCYEIEEETGNNNHDFLIDSFEEEQQQQQEDFQKKFMMEETKLIMIQKSIQEMNKHNQIEVGKILYSYKNITLNENRYGIFVNLTELEEDVIQKLYEYILYTTNQENSLLKIENEKAEFKTKYFSSD